MESVGHTLREARLRLGFTLEQVSATTRISVNILQAIETDEPLRVGSAFLYKSFLRQFAGHLHLDYNQLSPAVESAASIFPELLVPGQGVDLPKLAPLQAARPRKLRWLSSVASLFIMLLACSTFYGMWQSSRTNLHSAMVDFMGSVNQRSGPKQTVQRSHLVSHIEQKSRTFVQNNAAPVQTNGEFHIELSALERTWLSVVADGRPAFSGILEPSETEVLDGHDSARIRTGNAGGVNVVFNGRPLGPLGERGQVRTVVFTKDTYEVLQPAAHIAFVEFNQSGE